LQPTNQIDDCDRLDFPLCIDTEFVSKPIHWSQPFQQQGDEVIERTSRQATRLHITTQMRAIHRKKALFLLVQSVHTSFLAQTAKYSFDPVDYLQHLGYNVKLSRFDLSKVDRNIKNAFNQLPKFRVVLIAHFATAEIMLIVRNKYWDDFQDLIAAPEPLSPPGKPRFTLKRHLKAVTEVQNQKTGNIITENIVDLPWILKLNGRDFRISIEIVDTCALLGIASYADLCNALEFPHHIKIILPLKKRHITCWKWQLINQMILITMR
jgi:hypothetical protein